MQNLWDACLRWLEQELPAQQFKTWIRPLSPDTGAPSDTLTLTAPNRFVLELVRERFAARIERLAAEASGREIGPGPGLGPAREGSGREIGLGVGRARGVEPASRPAQPSAKPAAEAPIQERSRLNRGF